MLGHEIGHVTARHSASQMSRAQLAQIARSAILGPIYRELLSAGGVEISIRPAGHYVQLGVDYDVSALDRWSVTYPRAFVLMNGQLYFTGTAPVFEGE